VIFERVESEGLAHYSYIVGDGGEAVVVDPRRDCDVYVDLARKAGMRIAFILETHRNEDYVVGSAELADRTGASVHHADSQLDYRYGEPVEDGQTWKVGRLELTALHTPGHTPGHMSYFLRDPDGEPWVVFTGDSLFAGDLGRVDLLGEESMHELAGLMHDSIYDRLLQLGDGVIVCPAHGEGSVCGSAIAERTWTTIGLERAQNPKLQLGSREEFIRAVAVTGERPPYFERTERWNLEGAPSLGRVPSPPALSPDAFAEAMGAAVVVDTRTELAFGSAHVPGAQSLWLEGLASFGGWFLPHDTPLLLVGRSNDVEEEVRRLLRMGYDDVAGFLAGGMLRWHMAGKASARIRTYTVHDICRFLDEGNELSILDVRSDEENDATTIPDALHIHLTELPERLGEVPRDGTLYVFCGSGLRSMVAASYLRRQGFNDLVVILGGLAGWKSTACPLEL